MSNFIPRPSAETLELVQACSRHLRELDAEAALKVFHPTGQEAHAADPTPGQLDAVYATACGLCDEGNFRFAAALALHLVTYKPGDRRFSFIAGTCMHHLGLHAHAARLYCAALVTGGDDPATFYRLAECLLAVGDNVNAERALEAAVDLSRHEERFGRVQTMSHELLDTIKRNAT